MAGGARAERAHLGEEQVNLAAIAKLWAERRAGELLLDAGFGTHGGDRRSTSRPELESVGLTSKESHNYRKLAAVPADDFAQALDDQAASGAVTTAGTLR